MTASLRVLPSGEGQVDILSSHRKRNRDAFEFQSGGGVHLVNDSHQPIEFKCDSTGDPTSRLFGKCYFVPAHGEATLPWATINPFLLMVGQRASTTVSYTYPNQQERKHSLHEGDTLTVTSSGDGTVKRSGRLV